MRTSFVLVTDLTPGHLDWEAAREQAKGLAVSLEPRLGLAPRVRLASLPAGAPDRIYLEGSPSGDDLAEVLAEEAEAGIDEIFVVPTMLDFGLVQRARLSQTVGGIRLDYHRTLVAYDDVAFDRRPLLQAFSERIYQDLAGTNLSPDRSGLLLLASGAGDTSGRAQSCQLMRLVFDQLGFARGEVAFLDHARPLLEEQLERCAREGIGWVIVPQMMWRSEPFDEAQRRFDGFRQSHPEAQKWILLSPVGIRPVPVDRDPVAFNLAAWLEERIMVLWRSRRQQFEAKRSSPMQGESKRISILRGPTARLPIAELSDREGEDLWYGDGCIAEIYDEKGLVGLLDRMLGSASRLRKDSPNTHRQARPEVSRGAQGSRKSVGNTGRGIPHAEPVEAWGRAVQQPARTDRVFIKVTWHGYATGTYTDPVALDKLLAALPAQAVLVEGHTSSRNLGGSSWDWQTEGEQHRGWIAEQDAEYLRRTGLDEVIQKHKAQYLNVTETFWDGQCAPRETVDALLAEARVELSFPELAGFVPDVFFQFRGAPFISMARFKGPQRASITNMFGLIPIPLRTKWHGRSVAHFARVCCDLVKIYRCLFRVYGMVEALNVAVKWNPKGLYRSRWGNYDLIPNTGIVTLSPNLATADVLASRLQGLPVDDNVFFRTVRDEIGFPEAAARLPIPEDLVARLV
jgi:hypothetical protein